MPRAKKQEELWDAGCDIDVPLPPATGYVASVGRPDKVGAVSRFASRTPIEQRGGAERSRA